MKKILTTLTLLVAAWLMPATASEPDSAWIFSYATTKNRGGNGLHYAWSIDRVNWHAIGPEYRFLFSDFGAWGSQKRMLTPFVFQDLQGMWHAIWSLNDETGQFAHASSSDLYTWDPQAYPYVMEHGNVMLPEVSFDSGENPGQTGSDGHYLITWLSGTDGASKVFKTTTTDFKTFTPTAAGTAADRLDLREEVTINGEKQRGMVSRVSWQMVDGLIKWYEWRQYREQLNQETLRDDAAWFADLSQLSATISVNPENSKAISDMLIGIFFEDINYAADGGLYAELVQNRGFEYQPSDVKFRDKSWNSQKAWHFTGDASRFTIDTLAPLHPNQKHYAVLTLTQPGEALENEGFDGIPLKAGELYDFSIFARSLGGSGRLLIRLVGDQDKVLAEGRTRAVGNDWKKLEVTLRATENYDKARLQVIPQFTGKVALDMISLFPQKTFKGRKNGLRNDLAQAIADLHPRFVRFPGGCVAHGDGLHNIYRWKNTVGPTETRKPDRNIWNYHQSMGLGYYEYFLFCKDIGAEPIPVLAAGVPCQNSSDGGHGQQGGIPMCEMDDYVQEVLDLIEWANGDKNSTWGKVRAQAGHPEPFNLKYIGIGNEDLITDLFKERFKMIHDAIREKHPEIIIIGTVGPFSEGSDYRAGWEFATELGLPLVDEHYYQSPGWFLNNQDFYDRYDRSKSKVYLGEYATHIPGRRLNMETALCDALHLINVERNADVVFMTSYAPLLARHGNTQWNPDLIYFNNTEVFPTTDYYVQQMFGQNPGDRYLATQVSLSVNRGDVRKRLATSLVHDSKTGDYILRIANLLPLDVEAGINLEGLPVAAGQAQLTLLQGEVNDEQASPERFTVTVGPEFSYRMPPYSFSVIRMKAK